jgi:hypothetical protein
VFIYSLLSGTILLIRLGQPYVQVKDIQYWEFAILWKVGFAKPKEGMPAILEELQIIGAAPVVVLYIRCGSLYSMCMLKDALSS